MTGKRMVLAVLAAAAALLARTGVPARAAAPRPNVVVILADDMGYSDLACYGGELRTPNLDRLAAGGVRFTQFYNTARCCPTRASLLTGLYPHQAGVGHMMEDRGHDGYRGDLNRHCATIAEALRPAGYGTYAVGKWHVTRHTSPDGPKHNWPLQRGFDRYYGTIHGAGSYYDPSTLVRDNTMVTAAADPEYRPPSFYYTDAISDHAVRFVNEHRRDHVGSPFFLYVAYTTAHWPMHAPEEDVQRWRGKFDAGYDAIRRARLARQREMGLVDPRWQLTPTVGDWERVEDRRWEARGMEVYAAMVERMDRGIGRLVEALRAGGQLDNTLVMYLQDNGGCAEPNGRQGNTPRAAAPTLEPLAPEFQQQGSRPQQTRKGYPVLGGRAVLPGPEDTYIAYGQAWANVSNTPFREYKHWVHEGGIATPLIAHWPSGIRRRGALEPQPGHLIDVMATAVDVSGAAYPPPGSTSVQPLEGRSLVPTFDGKPVQRDALYWEHEGNRAVRAGKWKLVARGASGPWELYDMDADRTETHDLAAEQPNRVRELAAKWQAWAGRANVLPLNPRPARAARARANPWRGG